MIKNYVNELFNIKDKVAVITGAGGYLCGEIAMALYKAGAKVVIVDIREQKAKKIANLIKNNRNSFVLTVQADATKKSDMINVLDASIKKFGKVDILINGAGINSPTPFLEINEEEFHNVMDSQIKSTFLGCQVFGEYMIKNKYGCIINISSASAGPPLSKAFTYSIAKSGIKNLTQNLGREWGQKGVRVNAIRPGFFPTEWNRKNFITPEREKSILNHTPMRRYGKPYELVSAIIYLCSDSASFVTGTELTVDGGFSCMTI